MHDEGHIGGRLIPQSRWVTRCTRVQCQRDRKVGGSSATTVPLMVSHVKLLLHALCGWVQDGG